MPSHPAIAVATGSSPGTSTFLATGARASGQVVLDRLLQPSASTMRAKSCIEARPFCGWL